jgi:deazaflavin-dependent oxidoreductase (nitroreductase family)
MLEHTGRKTGTRRHAILEAVDRPRPGSYVVVSGLGDRSQRFRNVRAAPAVRVTTGWRRSGRATARVLSDGEASAALAGYAARHPRAWAILKPILDATHATPADGPQARPLLVAFDLAAGPAARRRNS